MRWTWLVGLLLLVSGAHAAPAAADALAGAPVYLALEHLDALGADLDRVLAATPPAALADAPPWVATPAARKTLLGFDAATAEGWASIGVDARGGLALALDPAKGRRELLVKVADEAKLLAALRRLGLLLEGPTGDGPERTLKLGPLAMALTQRGGYTVVALPALPPAGVPPVKAAALGEGTAWLSGQAPLAALALLAESGFPVDRFPAASVVVGPALGHARVTATPAGLALLRQLVLQGAPPAPFAAHFALDQGLRLDAAIPTFFAGVEALAPGQGAQAEAAVTGLLGITVAEAAEALTGQIFFQYARAEGEAPDIRFALALAVRDEAKADALIQRLLKGLAEGAGFTSSPTTVAGHAGFAIQAPVQPMIVLRAGKLVWFADAPSLTAALTKPKALPAALAARVDGPAPVGLLTPANSDPSFGDHGWGGAVYWRLGQAGADAWRWTDAQLDDQGVALRGPLAGLAATGVLFASIFPAFMQ
ncbi:MAG: hypothetical protein H6706_00650 [Myxococcales bacterium]|nr:hypothetical protein [Myxococcales bacterium]